MLADAGPHPNPGKAVIGQRLHTLTPNPVAAVVVERIYREFIGGKGIYAIAEMLTAEAIPSPSAHDPGRNKHRVESGGAWSKSAVRVILQNPRYTGRQVWNRQRRDEVLIDVDDVALGHETKMRWNDQTAWVWSQQPTHPPLVLTDMFETVQDIFATGQRTAIRKEKTRHPYVLSGLMRCGVCGRKMQASWNNGAAYYRCKFPEEYAIAENKHPNTVYVREAAVAPGLNTWIAQCGRKRFRAKSRGRQVELGATAVEHVQHDQLQRVRYQNAGRRTGDVVVRLERHRDHLAVHEQPRCDGG